MEYSLGIDFGSLSARAALVDLSNGKSIANAEFVYPHGIIGEGKTALQHPQDYIDALKSLVRDIVEISGASPQDIVCVGIDFTSSTVLPLDYEGRPLCFRKEFENEQHALAKLWKHHGAECEAEIITEAAKACGEEWLKAYGGKVSAEMMIPKILEIYNKAQAVYEEAAFFAEAGDYVVSLLTDKLCGNTCMAGFKSFWTDKNGYPSDSFFERIGIDFRGKLPKTIVPSGTLSGRVSERGAALTGLAVGTAVAAPIIDAHASVPAAGIADSGKLMLIIGTSACHIVLGDDCIDVSGIVGRVHGGVVPGLYAYEAGQSATGDILGWFVDNLAPNETFVSLQSEAEKLRPGESGLLAIDWWNGCRTPYGDYDLGGAIIGMNLNTTNAEIYRSLIEATAFGTKRIVDMYRDNGVRIDEIYASGGISHKNALLMQIYADVLNCKITVSSNSTAFGSAALGALAAGISTSHFAFETSAVYTPDSENAAVYSELYKEYLRLSEYFYKENKVLKTLRSYRGEKHV